MTTSIDEKCNCEDCMDSGHPCRLDCENPFMCHGCWEAYQESLDREFDEKCSLGYR